MVTIQRFFSFVSKWHITSDCEFTIHNLNVQKEFVVM